MDLREVLEAFSVLGHVEHAVEDDAAALAQHEAVQAVLRPEAACGCQEIPMTRGVQRGSCLYCGNVITECTCIEFAKEIVHNLLEPGVRDRDRWLQHYMRLQPRFDDPTWGELFAEELKEQATRATQQPRADQARVARRSRVYEPPPRRELPPLDTRRRRR